VLGIHAQVRAQRAETIEDKFDCVILRAVEKMPEAVAAAANLVAPRGWLALMTTDSNLAELQAAAANEQFRWESSIRLPDSDSRILALGQRVNAQA
jgi:16S rRNA G527 N7-methylase RsmG